MHTRISRGYLLGWGHDGNLPELTEIGTADGDWLSSADTQDDAERVVDGWLDAR